MKALFKGFALLGLVVCSMFAFDVIAEPNSAQAESVIPLRTHSIYMPYIGRLTA